jgi:hypothetical protein
MPDDMFFIENKRSLRRGRRASVRTETCRPCLLWPRDAPDLRYNGVALNISPHGMKVRMMDALPERQAIYVQMMRDDNFEVPLTDPMEARVVRCVLEPAGFLDHGIEILRHKMGAKEPRPVPATRGPKAPAPPSRMYTLDIVVGERGRTRRKSGQA